MKTSLITAALALVAIGLVNLYLSAQLASMKPYVAPAEPPTVPAYVENLLAKPDRTPREEAILNRYLENQ